MGITHLRGSLSQNITDITKGGGCPPIKPPTKKYSVLRYFSRVKDDTRAYITGVVGDGGLFTELYYRRQRDSFFLEPEYNNYTVYLTENLFDSSLLNANLGLNTKFLQFPLENGRGFFSGDNNYLNICNQRELIDIIGGSANHPAYISHTPPEKFYKEFYFNDEADNTICNIDANNNLIERDEEGYFNYWLYKSNHTMDIIKANETVPVSKTAELMEFVYLHAIIPKCKSGDLYVEIHDFEIVGDVTLDHMIHCYYWEKTADSVSISNSFGSNENDGFVSEGLLTTDNGNEPCKSFRLSDLQGQGENKKLIIWLNRNKIKGEKFEVNILIGLKPQDLRRDGVILDIDSGDPYFEPSYTSETYEPLSDVKFKFKKASIKIKNMRQLIINKPDAYPGWGYKYLNINTGSARKYFSYLRRSAFSTNITFSTDQTESLSLCGYDFNTSTNKYANITMSHFYSFGFNPGALTVDDSATYILRLPQIRRTGTTANGIIRIYVGALCTTSNNTLATNNFLNSLVLLESFSYSNLTSVNGLNAPRYISVSGSIISSIYPCSFFMSVEKSGYPFLSATFGSYDVANNEEGKIRLIPQYRWVTNSDGTIYDSWDKSYVNLDTMLFQNPQIIDKTMHPTAENYWP